MRICIVCYGHFDATLPLAKYLPYLNNEIHVELIFLLSQSSQIAVENVDLRGFKFSNGFVDDTELRRALGKEIYKYIDRGVRLRVFLFNSLKLADFHNHRLLRELRRYIVSQSNDLVHFVGNNNEWIIRLNKLLKGVPKVHTMHEPYPFQELSTYRKFRYRRAIQMLLNTQSHFIVPSQISYDRLRSHFDVRHKALSIIPFSVFEIYRSYMTGKLEKDPLLLLYYGSISEYKGVPDLLEAMRVVEKINPKIKCIIAGAGRLPTTAKNNVPKNVSIINRYLGNHEIAELNQMASAVICPYRSASQSGVVMTSFAFGNPVIATRVGAFPEMVKHNRTGILVQKGDVQALSEVIVEAFRDASTLTKLRQAVEKRYGRSKADWINICQQHYDLYLRMTTTPESHMIDHEP